MLGRLYNLSYAAALHCTQLYHDARRYPQGVRSPTTAVQRAQVRRLLAGSGSGARRNIPAEMPPLPQALQDLSASGPLRGNATLGLGKTRCDPGSCALPCCVDQGLCAPCRPPPAAFQNSSVTRSLSPARKSGVGASLADMETAKELSSHASSLVPQSLFDRGATRVGTAGGRPQQSVEALRAGSSSLAPGRSLLGSAAGTARASTARGNGEPSGPLNAATSVSLAQRTASPAAPRTASAAVGSILASAAASRNPIRKPMTSSSLSQADSLQALRTGSTTARQAAGCRR